jgi:hypothetical protein
LEKQYTLAAALQRTCSQQSLRSLGTTPESQSLRCRPRIANTPLYTIASRSDFISPSIIFCRMVLKSATKSDPQTKSVDFIGSYRHFVLVGDRLIKISTRSTAFFDRLTTTPPRQRSGLHSTNGSHLSARKVPQRPLCSLPPRALLATHAPTGAISGERC